MALMGTDFFCQKNDTFLLKVQLWVSGAKIKFEKVIDSSILTSLGNIFLKKSFFGAPTQEAVGGILLRI